MTLLWMPSDYFAPIARSWDPQRESLEHGRGVWRILKAKPWLRGGERLLAALSESGWEVRIHKGSLVRANCLLVTTTRVTTLPQMESDFWTRMEKFTNLVSSGNTNLAALVLSVVCIHHHVTICWDLLSNMSFRWRPLGNLELQLVSAWLLRCWLQNPSCAFL